MTTSTAIISL